MDRQENNFDFLRIFAAGLVLFSHQFALLGKTEPTFLSRISFGSLGVCIFFSISGYLVCQSWMRDPHAVRFVARRVLRIWPALFVVTALCVLVLGPLVSSLSLKAYFGSAETWNFFKALLLLIKYKLPGVFESNPFPDAINGSLWTIPIEVKWYVLMLVAGVLKLLRFRYLISILLIGLLVYYFGIDQAKINPKENYFLQYGLFFMSGVWLSLFEDVWRKPLIRPVLYIAVAAIAAYAFVHPLLGLWIFVPYAAIRFGLAATPVIRQFGRFGDFSYGLYIYAFPVQQLVVWWTNASLNIPLSLALSTAGTAILAFLSWHLVEKPALQFRPKQRARSESELERLLAPNL